MEHKYWYENDMDAVDLPVSPLEVTPIYIARANRDAMMTPPTDQIMMAVVEAPLATNDRRD